MANKIQVKRGLKADLPTLNVGEFAFCTDTKEVFVGSAEGNIRVDVADTERDVWNAKAPTSHASSAATYGEGDATNYGHVKLIGYDTTSYVAAENTAAIGHTVKTIGNAAIDLNDYISEGEWTLYNVYMDYAANFPSNAGTGYKSFYLKVMRIYRTSALIHILYKRDTTQQWIRYGSGTALSGPPDTWSNWEEYATNNAVSTALEAIRTELETHKDAAVLDHPDSSVTTAKLATDSVVTSKIVDGSVTNAKIAQFTVNDSYTDTGGYNTTLVGQFNRNTSAVRALRSSLNTHTANDSNPHNVTKEQVGLGNVDNISDKNKPISTATQAALDGKENAFTKNTAFNKNYETSTSNLLVDGTVSVGTTDTIARGNHRHPLNVDTIVPAMNGTAGIGSATTYARRDHVHPSDTTKENISNKGIANGYASLDGNTKLLLANMPDILLGQVLYGGSWNASTAVATLSTNAKTKLNITSNTITLTNNTTVTTGYGSNEGNFFITSTAGTFASISFDVGDWIISTGSAWQKIDNTDAVTGVKGDSESSYRIGNINITKSNIGLGNVANIDTTNPANIVWNASYRPVTDTQISNWDAGGSAAGGVTGVKGNSETSYRTGTVNLTVANIGAEAAQTAATQTEAEAGTSTSTRSWTPQRITQAVRGGILTGLSTATNAVITATDTVLSSVGKLQAQITAHKSDISNPHSVTASQAGAAPTSHASIATTYGISTSTNYGHSMASSATPLIAGTATVGTDNGKFAREGHVHPVQTTVSGNAGTATMLASAITIQTNLASTSSASFNGSADITPGITGTLPIANGGTGATTALAAALALGRGYGTCATDAATAAKVATLASYVRSTGSIVGLKFTYSNTATSPTLNVNSTGAAAIYDSRTATYPVSGSMIAGGTYLFQFNGTQWILLNPAETSVLSHTHAASDVISGILPVGNGGTGLNITPYMLINLASTTAASIFQGTSYPGVYGTLPVTNGGTGLATLTSGQALIGNGTSAVISREITGTPTSGSISLFTAGGAYTQLALKANLASPTFTGIPAAPTATAGTNTTQLATTAFVQSAITAIDNIVTTNTVQTISGAKTFTGANVFSSNGIDTKVTGTGTTGWQGRLIAGGQSNVFLLGQYNTFAGMGAHNAALNEWADFYINPDGTKAVKIGRRNDKTGWTDGSQILTVDNSNNTVTVNGNLNVTGTSTGSVPTFVYTCTGTADSTAIATIINNFFNTGTAMAMKLIISGTMGVAFTNTNYAMYINAANARGAVCYLDFSDCHIPTITTATRDFLHVSSSPARLNVTGLVVTTTRYGVSLYSSSNNSFSGCTIISSSTSSVELNTNSNYNNFINCTIGGGDSSTGTGACLIKSNYNSFNDCIISNGTNTSNYARSLALSGGNNNNSFSGCTITTSNGYGVYLSDGGNNNNSFSGCTINYLSGGYAVYLTSSNNNNNSFSGCIINSTGSAVYALSGFSGIVVFTACKITSLEYAVRCSTTVASTIIKLIGCSMKGGSTYEVYQSTAASTVTWYITGNSFAGSSIYVNGAAKSVSTETMNAYLYMPAYANHFSRTIE